MGRIAMILCIGAVIVTSFPFFIFADYFTNPPNFVTLADGVGKVETQDLSTRFKMGQTVEITWFVPLLLTISLSLAHWESKDGGVITSFFTNEPNLGCYTWTIGINDGLDLETISASPSFAFRLTDPTGNHTSTGHPIGFVDSTLMSRGFVIKPNVTASSSPSALVPALSTPSTLSSSPASTIPSPSATAASARTTPTLPSGPSHSVVAGLAAGFSVLSILAIIATLFLYYRRRGAKNVKADRLVRIGGLTGVNPMGPGLHAGPNTLPPVADRHSVTRELGDSTFFGQELRAERFSTQELEGLTLSRQELNVER